MLAAVRRLALLTLILAGSCAFAAAPAAAQSPGCAAPELRGFTIGENVPSGDDYPAIRAGQRFTLSVVAAGADRIAVDWGDQTQSTLGARAEQTPFDHTFDTIGAKRVVATATAACGASSTGALSLNALRPCSETTDASLSHSECDEARGMLLVTAAGLSTTGTWVNAPCRDSIGDAQLLPPEPVARAAACDATQGPTPVEGYLPLRRREVIRLELGAPARRLTVRLLGRRFRGRRIAGEPNAYSLRVPRFVIRPSRRAEVVATRASGTDRWIVGVAIR